MSGVEHGVEVVSAQVTAAVAIEELKALVLKEDIIIIITIIIPPKLHCALSLSVWMAEEDIQTSKDQTFIAQGNEFASALVHVALGCKARTESTAGKKTQTNKPQLSVSVAVSYHLPATPFGSRSPHIAAVDGQDAGEAVRTRAWHPWWACYRTEPWVQDAHLRNTRKVESHSRAWGFVSPRDRKRHRGQAGEVEPSLTELLQLHHPCQAFLSI